MSWLSEEDEDVDPLDADDFTPSDQLSDIFDENADEGSDAWSEEELDDSYDPTDVENYG